MSLGRAVERGAELFRLIRGQTAFTALMRASLALFALSATQQDCIAEERVYLLGPQDKIRLKVYEWRASRDEIFEWPALNQEFTVSSAGSLSLPLAGDLRVGGMSTPDAARAIADRLQTKMGLVHPPDTSIDVVQFRPFYVVGQVDRPGEFVYRPGLSVVQAVSIAGGLRKVGDIRALTRELISGTGDVSLLASERDNLLARRARLLAESKQSATVAVPGELRSRLEVPSVALALEQENLIFNARREALITQVKALEQLKAFLDKEEVSLQSQLALEDRQLQLIKKELQGVTGLVDKGLAVMPRQLALERALAQVEADRLRAETSILRAKQESSRTEVAILELRNKHANEIAAELRVVEAKLQESFRKLETSERLLAETKVVAASQLETSADGRLHVVYTVVGEGGVQRRASERDLLQAGDTLRVELLQASPERLLPSGLSRGSAISDGADPG
jgi:polysaccharide export outer membrane protein/exopolysaccharide production protein ExoF